MSLKLLKQDYLFNMTRRKLDLVGECIIHKHLVSISNQICTGKPPKITDEASQ